MQIDHDVHVVAGAGARRRHQPLGVLERRKAIERRSLADGEDLHRRKPVVARARSLLGEPFRCRIVINRGRISAAEMVVHAQTVAREPAEQLPQGNAEVLRLQIVQRLVDARQRRHGDHPALEERIAVHRLPEMLDPARIFADDQGRQVLDRADDGAGLEFERRLAEPDEPRQRRFRRERKSSCAASR